MGRKDSLCIPKINSSEQKGVTYKKLLDRHSEAVESKFYLEAIVLEYAMIEDRFTEMLRTLGIITLNTKETAYVPAEGLANDLSKLVQPNKEEKAHGEFKSISSKYGVIKALADSGTECPDSLQLQRECVLAADKSARVKKDGTRSDTIVSIIKRLEAWNSIRNQYIHALYNKDFEQAMAILPNASEAGIKLANEINTFSKRVITQARKRNIHRT